AHFEATTLPEILGRVVEQLARTATSLEEVRAVLEALRRQLDDEARRTDAQLEALVSDAEAKRQRYAQALERLINEEYALLGAGKQRLQTSEASVAHQRAGIKVEHYTVLRDLRVILAQGLAAQVATISEIAEALRDRHARIHEFSRKVK